MTTYPSRRRRVFYVAPLAIHPGARHLESPAARNKVLGVASAIRAAGGMPIVVSSTGHSKTSLRHPLHLHHKGGICFVEVFSIGSGAARRLSSLVSLVWIAITLVRNHDRVLLYNTYPDLIFLALCQYIRRSNCIIDLEDAPRSDETGALGKLTNIAFPILRWLCARPMVVASAKLAQHIRVADFLSVYGVSSFFKSQNPDYVRFAGPSIRIMFGGTVIHETGADLFVSAIALLSRMTLPIPVEIFVTGKFEAGLFDTAIAQTAKSRHVTLSIVQDLDTDRYQKLASTMDIGLCLKLTSSSMGQTTFPSKVIEIAALGMLLITTRVSDVPLIFDADSAMLLDSEAPQELANVLATAIRNRDDSRNRAAIGQRIVKERFSAKNVGDTLMAFLKSAPSA